MDKEYRGDRKTDRHLRKMAGLYGMIWMALAASFWLFYGDSQIAMLHVIVVQYVILPILSFGFSAVAGALRLSLRYILAMPMFFAGTYLLYDLLTLSLAQMLLAGVAAFAELSEIVAVVLVSATGILVGAGVGKLRK